MTIADLTLKARTAASIKHPSQGLAKTSVKKG